MKLTFNEKLFGVAAICGVVIVAIFWILCSQTPIEFPNWATITVIVLTIVMALSLILCGIRKLTGADDWEGLVG